MSTTDKGLSRISLGSCPDSWGVWFPEDPKQTPWWRFLDELAAAGYEWLELGPHGYLPTDPVQLHEEVGKRGLKVSGAGVFGALYRDDRWAADLADARKVSALVQAMGAHYLIYLPEGYRDMEGNFTYGPELDDDDWRRMVTRMAEVGKIVKEEHDVKLVFHPHADSHVGRQDQVERFLADTDPSVVSLCLDTGHIAYCGGDNIALIERFPERIGYVHLKQVDPGILAQVQAEQLGFAEAVRRGVMCEPPEGIPEMGPLLAAIGRLDADFFAIVEQDMYPCDPEAPLPVAKRTCSYFGHLGLGSGERQR
jgi:sugar phosphate isomerase/epimerase